MDISIHRVHNITLTDAEDLENGLGYSRKIIIEATTLVGDPDRIVINMFGKSPSELSLDERFIK